ncbi:phosphoenolpyruvate synthase [Methanomethylophilus alvi]|uniref:phosphoenolpyruvate synthase n=1 Tax=Methanomethylophilus alvi TaxID=1291540 RepID=UPI002AA296DD|nr:phosphoenolpyruvate synthase [Methanomethylophilus alvi]
MDSKTAAKRIIDVNELRVNDVPIVGGKGANLGELTSSGFPVPHAFVLTTVSYDYFISTSKIMPKILAQIKSIDPDSDDTLVAASNNIRELFDKCEIPKDLKDEIKENYNLLLGEKKGFVAVRSSATAEDLPDASFAGQQETYLNVKDEKDLFDKIRKCWSSLFTARAISYRETQGYSHEDVKLAVVVQRMVNSEFAGIMFTVDPHNGAKNIIVEGGYGLGEAMVGGEVTPDTYQVDKSKMAITNKRISKQTWKYIRGPQGGAVKKDIPVDMQKVQKIPDDRVLEIAEIGRQVEIHYDKPMDMEWCIEDNKVYLVQARPITAIGTGKEDSSAGEQVEGGDVVLSGLGASPGMATGRVCIYDVGMSLDVIKDGDVLVTKMTMPDMVPAMSRSVAIVTDEGGMTCHAAIISRELGTPCVVGTGEATNTLKNGEIVTVDGSTGTVYRGEIKKKVVTETAPAAAASAAVFSEQVPITGTKVMVNMSMPSKAEEVAKLPCDGVGLLRSEFLFTNYIGEHPCAVIQEGRAQELIDKLADGVAKVARAFYPRPVTLRTSDFKTNEYRDMKGGANFEPNEDNPMIGWRGCSRYVSDSYREAFMCELKAIKKARDEMGMKNINIMLPFVRTIDEVKQITAMMESVGLRRGLDLKLYFMAEVPVNIFMAEEFCKYCDWFSIGSNDLTQLTMGCDRDSDILGKMGYFDERNPGVKAAIKHLIKVAHKYGNHVSICGQAPSVYPEFCEFLVEQGIDCISLNPDTFVRTKKIIASAEQRVLLQAARKVNRPSCDDEDDF